MVRNAVLGREKAVPLVAVQSYLAFPLSCGYFCSSLVQF